MLARLRHEQRGSVLVATVAFLPVAIVLATLALDTGNWWVHKRHLQTQADAAAFAGAGAFRVPCDDDAITSLARTYSGDTPTDKNQQVGGTSPDKIHMLVNSPTFFEQSVPPDTDVTGAGPCLEAIVDVKMTEKDLPYLLRLARVDYMNAQARIAVRQIDQLDGMLPLGVPDASPIRAAVTFIDESTGEVLGQHALARRPGTSGGLAIWDNATDNGGTPLSLNVTRANIGVRVALGGGTSTTCGDARVECFDLGSANGLVHIRGWSAQPAVAVGGAPRDRGVALLPGTCSDAYFSAATSTCAVGISARVDFAAGVNPATSARVTAVAGANHPLTYDAATQRWIGGAVLPVAAGAGAVPITLEWEQTTGSVGTDTCKSGGGNKCTGSFGVVQRSFSGSDGRSGPIKLVQVADQVGTTGANDLERCSTSTPTCAHDFVVTIGLAGGLRIAQPGDPPVALRVGGGGSQNQSLDCDPDVPKLKDELAQGCGPFYRRNSGESCPSSLNGIPQPWTCVAIQTGAATNQVPAGMNMRILGDEKPASCTNPNRYPDYQQGDPRILPVFVTPFGSFSGSGSGTVPVQEFAYFYVTGWTGSGGGFANPCEGLGDVPTSGMDSAFIYGHFIRYVVPGEGASGEDPCDLDPDSTSLGGCIAVLTR